MSPVSSTLLLASLAVAPVAAQAPQFVVETPAGLAPFFAAQTVAFDFDGDGDLDLLGIPTFFLPAQLARNDGRYRFADVSSSLPPVGIRAAVPLDADQDGDLDLAIIPPNQVAFIALNNGAGSFSVGPSLPFSLPHVSVAAADRDGDGDIDLAMSGGALLGSCDRIYVNNGGGTFVAGPVLDCPFLFHNVVASDIDSDGDVDLMFTGGGLHVYENQGSLTFVDTTATVVSASLANAQSVIAQGDFDGDGDEDFLADTNVVMVNVAGVLIAGTTLPAQANVQSVAVADIDGDGDLDIARSGTATPVTLAINDGAASFSDASNRLPSLTLSGWSVTLADLDGDRDPEILADGGLPTAPTVVLRNRDVDLTASAAVIGQAWQVEVGCRPGYATATHPVVLGVGLARLPQPVSIPVHGDLWLDFGAPTLLTTGIVNAAVGNTVFSFAVPNAQGLIGVELHAQALVDRAPDPPRLSALRSVVVQ